MTDTYHMSQSQYAKHRKISQPRIAKLIGQGKLDGAYKKKGRRYFINPIVADKILETNRDPIHDARLGHEAQPLPDVDDLPAPPSAETRTLNEAARLQMWYRAALLKIKYERETGEVIPKDEVLKQAASVGAMVRTQLESLPAKIANELVGIDDPKKAAALIRREVKAALTSLSHEIENLYPNKV